MSAPERPFQENKTLATVRAAVELWRAGTISAPEAIARVSRAVGVSFVDMPRLIDPADQRLAKRRVLHRTREADGTEIVALECGHHITRVPDPAPAARVQCPDCVNELIEEHGGPRG